MSGVMQEFTDLLLKQRVISLDQLSEVEEVAKTTNAEVGDVLIQMEYATPEEVAQAMAKHHKMPYVDLQSVQISDSVIESPINAIRGFSFSSLLGESANPKLLIDTRNLDPS